MTFFTFCNSGSERQILHKIRRLIFLINQTRWIIEAYVSDFYTLKHWQSLTRAIQDYIDATEPPDWAWLLDQHPADMCKPCKAVAPLSLLALKGCTQSFSLERTAIDLNQAETIQSMIDVLQQDSLSKMTCLDERMPGCNMDDTASMGAMPFQKPNYKNGQCMDMQHIFRKHVKPKKQHEIQQLGQIIHVLSQRTKCTSVIDVGAGLGHLSRLLTFAHGLKVTTIEAADSHAPKATEFDRELKKDVLKKLKKETVISSNDGASQTMTGDSSIQTQEAMLSSSSSSSSTAAAALHQNLDITSKISTSDVKSEPRNKFQEDVLQEENLPSHMVCYIQPDIASSQFLDILKKTKCADETADGESRSDNFILAGLHTCGDLAPTLLKVFVNCPMAVAIASVGCCYMKMEARPQHERSPSNDTLLELDNYPMSAFLQQQDCHILNYESREMACHFADAYCERLKDNPIHLKIHSYRAALQYLIKTVSPDFASGQTRLVHKKGAHLLFPQYACEILKKLDIDKDSVPLDLMQECELMTSQWKRVVAFYTIRLSLAPVVETLILLDRILFLKELGINSALVPIFDSRLSPRNFALIAIK